VYFSDFHKKGRSFGHLFVLEECSINLEFEKSLQDLHEDRVNKRKPLFRLSEARPSEFVLNSSQYSGKKKGPNSI
jgi:hypothetical protein